MTEEEFVDAAERLLTCVESVFADLIDVTDVDWDVQRLGSAVLELEFGDRSKLVLNAHAAMREIWLASRQGGQHFRYAGEGGWLDTRSQESLHAALERALVLHAAEPVPKFVEIWARSGCSV